MTTATKSRTVSPGNLYALATPAQVDYATALARKAGYRFLSDAQKACFGKLKINGIKRGEMSELIDWLTK